MRKQILTRWDTLALGFMTLALFLGAGNIIYPPYVGKLTGGNYLIASGGFIVSGVVLPMLAVLALANKGGDPLRVCAPLGKFWGTVLAASFYLFLGVFFASPRTATVSYEMGLRNFVPDNPNSLYLYTFLFFIIVGLLGLYPHRLLKTIGYILAPLKLLCLGCLAVYAVRSHVDSAAIQHGATAGNAFSTGMINGYLTMDTLSALTFGVIIINSLKEKGINEAAVIKKYTRIAVCIAAMGLIIIYFSLMHIGAGYAHLSGFDNGAQILRIFIVDNMGMTGSLFMAVLIYLACTVTAVGLTSSTASLFSQMLKVKYPVMLALVVFCSFLLANFGLTRLIAFSVPALSVICPACTTLIVLSLLRVPEKAIALSVWVSIIFSFNDAVLIPFGLGLPFSDKIPLSDVSLSWLFPAVVAVLIACIRLRLNEKLKPETHCL